MSVAITIRNVPDEVRDVLAARAAGAGQSLQEYLRAHLIETASRPSLPDVIARARSRVAETGTRVDMAYVVAELDQDRR
ncbi:hypothetical protein GCM10009547_42010 [Sporichthya brevicatena]|uniref:Antitoxin FitA-like ribbon-helix-helix domain-containing protein n=1 Tax=Sporichthya brevicatena TaxID=171442 RepID=A0ABN1HA93_9ACTN